MSEQTAPDWFVTKLQASVKEKRAAGAGMTEIAFRCGVSTQMLYSYLRGEGHPKIDTFVEMARYFGWPIPFMGEEPGEEASGHSAWSVQTPPDLGERVLMTAGL